MSTLTRTETGKDARGNKYLTNTYESFTALTPTTGVSSYTLTQEDGRYTLVETFTEQVPDPGGGGGGETFPTIWSLDVTTGTEPIETNPTFRDGMSAGEMADWTKWKQGRQDAPDPATSSNSVVRELYTRYNRGETDYLAPRATLKLQKVYATVPSLAGVGYAQGTPAGCPFTFANGCNWLFTGAHVVTEGSKFRVTQEWLASINGPWDSYIYGNG